MAPRTPSVKINVQGARGESQADILRRTGQYGVLPTDTDTQAMAKLNAVAIQAANDAQAAKDGAVAAVNYRPTIALGIADFAVGSYFTSDDQDGVTSHVGELRTYKRIAASPFYEDMGDSAAPASKLVMDSVLSVVDNLPSVSVDDFYLPSDTSGDYTEAFERASEKLFNAGGGIITVNGIKGVRYVNLRKGVYIQGASLGDRKGGSGSVIQALPSSEPHLIRRNDVRSISWGLRRLVIMGAGVANPNQIGLYIYDGDTGEPDTNDTNEYCFIDEVIIRGFDGDGVNIDGAGSVGSRFYNPKNIYINRLKVRENNGFGIRTWIMTDSYWNDIELSRNVKGAGNFSGMSNCYVGNMKGFYNGATTTASGSFNFFACSRNQLVIQAQEEYINGIRFKSCDNNRTTLTADANGFPNSSAVTGVILEDDTHSSHNIVTDSFHAPDFLQNRALSIIVTSTGTTENLDVKLKSMNQVSSVILYTLNPAGTFSNVTIDDNGTINKFRSSGRISNVRRFPTDTAYVEEYNATDTASQHNRYFSSATGQHEFWNFRLGVAAAGGGFTETWFKGDGTDTVSHRLQAGGDARFCEDSTLAYDAGHFRLGAERVFKGQGALRIKSGSSPNSATDGDPIGLKVTIPATSTDAGVPGNWAAGSTYAYFYTGNGTTHSWVRVAVASW